MDNKELFSSKSEYYSAGRPTYPLQLFEYLFDKVGFDKGCTVADIGSGTGIFSKQLADFGCMVICVEPNDDMRSIARQNLASYENVSIINGDAEHTGAADNSVDFITAAQAFHWFDTAKFRNESKRLLRQNGKAVLVWNTRDKDCELSKANYEIFAKYCPRFKGFSGGIKENDDRIAAYFSGKYETVIFDNPIVFDRAKFINRCLSASYSLGPDDAGYCEYLAGLNKLFDKFADGETMTMSNKTVAYVGALH